MKILLCDDHAVVRQGYASLLSAMLDGGEIIEAENGWDAVSLWQQHAPDVVILDINLPDISGVETARRILQRDSKARVMFFSMYDELPMVQQALNTGALGYITKSSSPEVLLDAVRKVLSGQPYVEHDLATRLALQRNNGMDPRLSGMTQREFEIFVMLARGLTSKAISEQLCISVKTVSNHSALLKNKLQVSSTAELVHLAIECGVLRLGPASEA